MTTDPFAALDAAYSLGALDADDLVAYEAHLRTCAACRARVDELRPTVRLLAAARGAGGPGMPRGDDPVPDTLLPGLLRRAERERARRRWVTRGVAGLAAACLVALVVAVWPRSASQPVARALVSVGQPVQVKATARLQAERWGTRIDVHCAHDQYAVQYSGRYTLLVIDRDHHTYDLGSWSVLSERAISFTSGVDVRRERIARVQITQADGTPILQLTL